MYNNYGDVMKKIVIAVSIILVLIISVFCAVKFLPVSSILGMDTISKGTKVYVNVYNSENDKNSEYTLNQEDADKIIDLINSKNNNATNYIPSFDYPACMFDESLYLKINGDKYYMSVCCRDKICRNSPENYFCVDSSVIDDIYNILADNGYKSTYDEIIFQ